MTLASTTLGSMHIWRRAWVGGWSEGGAGGGGGLGSLPLAMRWPRLGGGPPARGAGGLRSAHLGVVVEGDQGPVGHRARHVLAALLVLLDDQVLGGGGVEHLAGE